MSTFADTSALVKLYVPEAQHQPIRELSVLVVSQLASVEVPAVMWLKSRTGKVTAADARQVIDAFEADYHGTNDEPPRFEVVTATEPILDAAARMAGTHGLRAYDAVQLASARLIADEDPECTSFAAFDATLRNAAAAEGFTLVP